MAVEGLQNAVPYISDYIPWWVTLAIFMAAIPLRIIDQGNLNADQQD
ncbi:hypothetical protein [Allorhizobium ampelinum]|nr:hypothetical protein [Allorhizobium ampelinum]NTA27384.1 hypothetical protein [Allorhizobium ampelinum]